MAGVDYINALGAGASFDTKSIVEALVQAERTSAESQIQRKLAASESKISGLGNAVSILDILKQGAELLNDARDFNTLNVQNTSQGAVVATATNNARAGTNSISVTSLAKEQRTISAGFDTDTGTLNNGDSISIDITVNGATETLSLESVNLTSVAAAINDADLGVSAEIINTGTGSGSYRLQLVGEEGSSNAFTISSDFAGLTFNTIQSASDAELNVNGVERQFSPDEMPATLSELLKQLDVETAAVAVAEIDGVIVRPEGFARTKLADGQRIELVRFVGGG